MKRKKIWLLICFFPLFYSVGASEMTDTAFCDTILVPDSLVIMLAVDKQDVMNVSGNDSLHSSKLKSKKRIAAVLAFPFPFGLLGLHRVFLGTKPYIPFVYIGTLGGCFLILPIIDFITILSANEEEFKKFENNPKVFMWSH